MILRQPFSVRFAAPLFLVAALAACAVEPEPEFGECEPGVSDLSRTATATPCP